MQPRAPTDDPLYMLRLTESELATVLYAFDAYLAFQPEHAENRSARDTRDYLDRMLAGILAGKP